MIQCHSSTSKLSALTPEKGGSRCPRKTLKPGAVLLPTPTHNNYTDIVWVNVEHSGTTTPCVCPWTPAGNHAGLQETSPRNLLKLFSLLIVVKKIKSPQHLPAPFSRYIFFYSLASSANGATRRTSTCVYNMEAAVKPC